MRFVAAVTQPLAWQISEVSPQTDAPVIWMGVDCDRFVPGPRKPNPVFTVATVARLNHAKGHRFFLRAMARLRDEGTIVHYKIAGDGPERDRIAEEIRELGLQDQVEMLGIAGRDGDPGPATRRRCACLNIYWQGRGGARHRDGGDVLRPSSHLFPDRRHA